jgi:hypothetical protein
MQNWGFVSLDLSKAHLSDPYIQKALSILKLANYQRLHTLKLDGCQITQKSLFMLRDFIKSQVSVLNDQSTLRVLSLKQCGLCFIQPESSKPS